MIPLVLSLLSLAYVGYSTWLYFRVENPFNGAPPARPLSQGSGLNRSCCSPDPELNRSVVTNSTGKPNILGNPFAAQRTERVNVSGDKTVFLDGNKIGIGWRVAQRLSIGAAILSAWRNVKTHDSGRDMAMDKSTCKTRRVNTRQGGIASKTSGHPYPRKSGDYACMCHAGSNPAALAISEPPALLPRFGLSSIADRRLSSHL